MIDFNERFRLLRWPRRIRSQTDSCEGASARAGTSISPNWLLPQHAAVSSVLRRIGPGYQRRESRFRAENCLIGPEYQRKAPNRSRVSAKESRSTGPRIDPSAPVGRHIVGVGWGCASPPWVLVGALMVERSKSLAGPLGSSGRISRGVDELSEKGGRPVRSWSASRTVAGRDSVLVGIRVVGWVRRCALDPTDAWCRVRASQTGTAASYVPPAVAVVRRSLWCGLRSSCG